MYPPEVAARLESARALGPRDVPLAGLGGIFEELHVELVEGDPTSSTAVQRSPVTGGRRDVRRVEVPADATEVAIHVVRERAWRIADFSVPGVTEERRTALGPMAGSGAAGRWPRGPHDGGHHAVDDSRELEARAASVAGADAAGLVGLWEWCRLAEWPGHGGENSVPPDMWGAYSAEQNRDIEVAFRAGQRSVAVSIGIREYEILFEGNDRGRQVDRGLKKRRFVRRRQVKPEEQEAAFRAAVEAVAKADPALADGECAICCTTFSETPAIPVVRLPSCGHHFHGACVQHLADKGSRCPFCRAEVDWAEALAPHAAGHMAV